MSNLRINTSTDLDQQRLAQLLAQQVETQAQIDSLLAGTPSTNSYQHHRSPIHKQQQQRRSSSNVPRSMSSTGAPSMSRHLSSDRSEAAAISRSISQRSAPSMARTNSRGSSSQRSGKIPFTSNGSMRSMPPPLESRRDNPAMTAWTTPHEQPLSSYTLSHQPQSLQRSVSQRKSELERVPEHGRVLEDPSAFISRNFGNAITPTLSVSPPMSMPSSAAPTAHRLSTGSFNIPAPSTPSTDTMTNATTVTNNTMSRTNSLFDEPLPESLQMMRFSSSTSYSDISHVDQPYDQTTPTFSSSCHSRRSSNEEQSQLLVGAGGASHDSPFSHSLPTHFTSSSFGEKMGRSQSNESNSSSSSRNKQRLQIQNQLAASRPLMPKGGSDDGVMSRNNSSQSMSRLESKDGSQDKLAISKSTYQRPKHDRVYCNQCESHSEGFRGEHELRRHQDREHKQLVKKWICIEPTVDGHNHPTPVLPLSRCKACGQQKKRYGAYYNAAAHLRRTHFKPKTSKGRSKGSKELDEKRGGKAGGDWPPMSELKYWMKEVEEPALEYSLTESQQDEVEESDDEIETPLDEQILTLSSMPNNSFNTAIFADSSPLFNTYQPNVNDVYSMQMSLDSQSQCMDQSIYSNSSQGSFPDFSPQVYQNDPMGFFDTSLPPNFEDQVALACPDFVDFSYQ